jgi:hypothetical protein
MQSDESLLSRAMLRCSLTSRSKDTTPSPRNPNFFASYYRTSKVFHILQRAFSPLYTGIPAHFPHAKNNEIV